MNGQFIRKNMIPYLGSKMLIQYNLGRNKYEKYVGILKEIYPHVFILKDKNNLNRCFSYSDIVMKNIKIKYL